VSGRSTEGGGIASDVLIATGCSAGYGAPVRPVVSDIDVTVSAGEIVTIVGRSGSGKSTLLLALSGLRAVASGTVTIDGTPVTRGDRRVGLVLQHYGLFPWYTVRDNVALGTRVGRRAGDRRSARSERDEARSRVSAMLQRVGLGGKADRFPSELSGGEQQRVALARTLLLEPRALLLDEPFSALDALTREELQDQLLDLLSESRTAAIMVTHSMDEAAYLGDRVGILVDRDGPSRLRLVESSLPRDLRGTERRTSRQYAEASASLRRRFREALGA